MVRKLLTRLFVGGIRIGNTTWSRADSIVFGLAIAAFFLLWMGKGKAALVIGIIAVAILLFSFVFKARYEDMDDFQKKEQDYLNNQQNSDR